MKAMLVNENKDLVWSDVADPVIKDDEVLVKIHAAALNRADLLQRQGKYPSPAGCPEWMGLEIAGVIVSVGRAVVDWKIGDRVCALLGGGGYAEYVAVKYDMLMPVPKGLSIIEAAALPEADIEIVENHHIRKIDAPSGTALSIAEAIIEERPDAYVNVGRSGHGKRDKKEIGIHAVRMGNVVGEHEVILCTPNQTVTLKHEAHNRALFAEGGVCAAEFIIGKSAGLYDMKSLVGKKDKSLAEAF